MPDSNFPADVTPDDYYTPKEVHIVDTFLQQFDDLSGETQVQTADDHGVEGDLPPNIPPDDEYSSKDIQVTDTFLLQFESLGCEAQVRLLSQLFSHHCSSQLDLRVPEDFQQLLISAMKNLQMHNKVNVLYGLVRGLGCRRPDSSDSVFPITRMPFGLLEYMISFFNSTSGQTVRCLRYKCCILSIIPNPSFIAYRFNAQRTMVIGYKPCMFCSEPNSQRSFVVL